MRNPERIKDVMLILTEIWKLQTDTRFNQLIHNLQHEFANKYNTGVYSTWDREDIFGRVSFTPIKRVDLFNVEDDKFLEFLQWKYNELQKTK